LIMRGRVGVLDQKPNLSGDSVVGAPVETNRGGNGGGW